MDNPFAPSPKKSPPLEKEEVSPEPVPETAPDSAEVSDSGQELAPETSSPEREVKEAPAETAEVEAIEEEEEEATEVTVSKEPTAPSKEIANDSSSPERPPPLDLEEISCRSCRYFFFPEGTTRMDVLSGECRCKAPTPGINEKASWPTVDWGSWCGEWEQGISNDDMVRLARDVAEQMNDS